MKNRKTKLHHVEGAARAVELKLLEEDIKTLEEKYIPHPLAGVMAQNTKKVNRENQVWMKNGPKS